MVLHDLSKDYKRTLMQSKHGLVAIFSVEMEKSEGKREADIGGI